jgi:hypothetical protein
MRKALAMAFVAAAATVMTLVVSPVSNAAPPRPCWTVPATAHDPVFGRSPWTYTHTVSWCGDLRSFKSTTAPRLDTGSTDGSCVWQGIKDQSATLTDRSWTTFSMGEFQCTDGIGVHQVNPWVIVTAYPDGRYDVGSGTR